MKARRQAAELTDQLASLQVDVAAQTERAAAGEARAAELEKRANEVHDDLKAERARRDEAEALRAGRWKPSFPPSARTWPDSPSLSGRLGARAGPSSH